MKLTKANTELENEIYTTDNLITLIPKSNSKMCDATFVTFSYSRVTQTIMHTKL